MTAPSIRRTSGGPTARRRGLRGVAVTMLATVLIAGCAGPVRPQDSPAQGEANSPSQSATAAEIPSASLLFDQVSAEEAFGPAVPKDGSVTYQPDVVVVGGGGAMVRDVSDDALTWTIARDAPGLDKVKVGDVMLLTGLVSGRVLERHDTPAGTAVVLGPVDITDVIRDGHFSGQAQLDLDNAPMLVFPELPGAVVKQPTGDQTGARLQIEPASFTQPTEFEPIRNSSSAISKGSVKTSVGPFAVKLKDGAAEVSLNDGGLEMVLSFGPIIGAEPTDYAMDIVGGAPTSGHLVLNWLKGLVVKIKAGSTSGLSGNIRYRVEVPITWQIPIDPPLYANLKFKFFVETVFTAKSSFLTDEAQYDFTGTPGWTTQNGNVTLNAVSIRDTVPALDQLEAVSLGATGMVFAFQVNDILGLGTPLFTAGPFVESTISWGLAVGSDAGIRGVKCHQATTKIVVGGGWGFRLADTDEAAGAINKVLSGLGRGTSPKLKLESLFPVVQKNVYGVSTWSPDVPICQLAS